VQVCESDGMGYHVCQCPAGGGASGSVGTGGVGLGGPGGASGQAGASGGVAGVAGGTGGSVAGGGASAGAGGAVSSLCGNGMIDPGEACDDANAYAGDGCSPDCQLEDPFVTCTGAPSVCTRSCFQLGTACGPNEDQDCCATIVVPGISNASFYRSYDGVTAGYTSQAYPAKVSDFRLDKYEVVVARFQKFYDRYNTAAVTPAPGSGKNPNDPSDTGWDPAWDAFLPYQSAGLTAAVECNNSEQTWTSKPNDPLNCVSWYVAQAFCIWDGGRLPTEAEWNYAAAGGTEQRVYPWGSTAPGNDDTHGAYGCFLGNGPGVCFGSMSIATAGLLPGDTGKWGHADLAGNLSEWVQDAYVSPYATPCDNCTDQTATAPNRGVRGGDFKDDATLLFSSYRSSKPPATTDSRIGVRCARTAP
jgi:sulfatase modifying factor 1